MKRTIYCMAVALAFASCTNSETETSKTHAEIPEPIIESADPQIVSEDLDNEATVESKTFTNESLIGDWTYKKNVTTVGTEVIELVVTDNWQLKFDGTNCTDIQDGDDAQINPYLIQGDSLIFTELRFLSKKIVDKLY